MNTNQGRCILNANPVKLQFCVERFCETNNCPIARCGLHAWLAAALTCAAAPQNIRPGTVWLDNRGFPVQAPGGGLLKFRNSCY